MPHVSVILPCLNEEESLGACITNIQTVFNKGGIDGEIIVVDNGSTDNSATVAKQFDITYCLEPRQGYGRAYRAGLQRAQGHYLILGDPDGSYDFNEIPQFLHHLKTHDAVLGSRFAGKMEKDAMPFLHRYVGNPTLLFLMRLFFGLKISEPSTGFIGLRREIIPTLNLKEPGMEFSSEMLVRIHTSGFRLKEIPITYHVRSGTSKLRTFRDGFRHFKFLMKEKFNAKNALNNMLEKTADTRT